MNPKKKKTSKRKRQGLQGIDSALKTIENAMPISNNPVLKEFSETLKKRTNNFSNADDLSTEKVELKTFLDSAGASAAQIKAAGIPDKMSEVDVVEYLADKIAEGSKQKAEGIASDEDAKAKKLKLMKMKAKALELEAEAMAMQYKYDN